ncbi:reticulon-4-interacting protein 1 homolog, mitochondrial-like isoform X5 [Alosa sapidissima]|uniref:reticulon-4-interacting protein 1 homolog, mitochondrial-like isoform X5 n=1 Tax=Alosa sapidissima TaxID=34773 RepID=UPI001C0A5C5A|nr:reticulon-4-interacting protein 1 homolog, mitochondrial-like isoform X5 [Alosa sapidissima]
MLACQRWLRPQNVNFLRLSSETLRRLAVYPCTRNISLSVARSHGASMRAWVINRYGTNDELALMENHPAPSVNHAHEVLVKVHAASLNPLDISMRGGYGAGVLRLRRDPRTLLQRGTEFPLVLGRDVSGVALECGSGVTHVQAGNEVWASIPPWQQGSFAECVLLNGSDVSLKPKALSHVEAASIPYVAATAWSALVTTGGLHSENCSKKRILVHGASGGIGTFSIQLLKAWGGHVTATCFKDGLGLVKELGADDVIDCSTTDAASQLRTRQKFDLILDNVGGETDSWAMDLLKPWAGSKFVTLVSPLLRNTDSLGLVDGVLQSGMTLHDKAIRSLVNGVFYRWAFYVPDGVALDRIGQLVSSGKIRPVVEATYPFSQVPEAFRKVETGQARGKTVITVATEEAESSSSTRHTDGHTLTSTTHDTDVPHTHTAKHTASPVAEEKTHATQTHTPSPVMVAAVMAVEGLTVEAVEEGRVETGPAFAEGSEHPGAQGIEAESAEMAQGTVTESVEMAQAEAESAEMVQCIEAESEEIAQGSVAQAAEMAAQAADMAQAVEMAQGSVAQAAEMAQGSVAQAAEMAAKAADMAQAAEMAQGSAAQAAVGTQMTETVDTGHR